MDFPNTPLQCLQLLNSIVTVEGLDCNQDVMNKLIPVKEANDDEEGL